MKKYKHKAKDGLVNPIGLSTPSSFTKFSQNFDQKKDQQENPQNYAWGNTPTTPEQKQKIFMANPPASGRTDYVPIEALALPGTPVIKGIGKLANLAIDVINPISGLGKLKSNATSAIFTRMLDNSKLNKELAGNLYVNRILEEELVGADSKFKGIQPSLPEGSRTLDIHGSPYVQSNGRIYYVGEHTRPEWATGTGQAEQGFDLIDNTYDFMPKPGDKYPFKSQIRNQKKYGVSDKSPSLGEGPSYTYEGTTGKIDDWIIHNDKGAIKGDATWWLKGEPYKGMEQRKLLDPVVPGGRHVFAKQSSLESALGKPLDEHRELLGDVVKKGEVQKGGITITPTNEEFLQKIKDLKIFTHNPITQSLERKINFTPSRRGGTSDKVFVYPKKK